MKAVVTGSFEAYGLKLTRARLSVLCQVAGIELQDAVHWDTTILYAANVSGTSSKLRQARATHTPIRDYVGLYIELQQRLTLLNHGEMMTPGHAIQRIERYGLNNWRTGSPLGSDSAQYVSNLGMPPEIIRHRQLGTIDPNLIQKKVVQPVAQAGQLTITRRVKL